ncbi:DEAD/DEAH box helicase family protein [Virgibacillus sp. C22-A2]|uniref:DEAD/DEAH box helicase family protein n=1 Tax=Virgibacillus tibetensis TaxID=3042313 RepID=A0ABU6KIM9_9BACI|nr:DEAD/DEAH box helicase family protein [Virgibacillus sp. C22-A2]
MGKTKQDINEYKGYHDVTAGSLIHILRQHGIDTSNVFTFSEKSDLQPDITLNITGKIFDNKDVYLELKRILTSPTSRGKRILLVSDTGTGKSFGLIKMIHELNEKVVTAKSSDSFSNQFAAAYACPRRALINNLKGNFESDGNSTMLTGSDGYSSLERDIIFKQAPSFITTIDHAPRILESKLNEKRRKRKEYKDNEFQGLLITDEIHVLSTDASFKLDTIRDYFISERSFLDMGGVSLFVTATPENLFFSEYDLIIQINQEDHEKPFKEAGYSILSNSTKELKSLFLRMIRFAVETNKDRQLLVFIEDTSWIEDYCQELQQQNINAIGIMAKKESERQEEEITIIDKGNVSGDIQVILSTTVLSSGVSITNNQEKAETWVLCSHNSMNHELTRLIQMSHRFRNKYNAFKIFFQKADAPKQRKAFLYQTFLKEEIKKAVNSKELIKKVRKKPTDFMITLDSMEKQSGLFSDDNGNLHVLTPMIQSNLIRNKTYYNYKNQDVLIRELEQRFQCEFKNLDENMDDNEEEDEEEANAGRIGLSNLSSKEIIKMIIEDKSMYERLKKEYIRYGLSGKNGLIGKLEKNAKNDFMYFIEHGVDYEIVKQVMKCHLKAGKDGKCSYLEHKVASQEVEKIKKAKDASIQVTMYQEVCNRLELAKDKGGKDYI